MNVAQTKQVEGLIEVSKGKNVFEQAPIPAAPKAQKAEKAAKPQREKRAGTKQEKAIEIYKRLNGVRADVVAVIQKELGMSLAGSTTYFYNAKKAVGKIQK